MLLDGERQSLPGRGLTRRGLRTGHGQGRLAEQLGEEPQRRRDRAVAGGEGAGEDGGGLAGQGHLELEAGLGEAAARKVGQGGGRRSAELRLQRVVEAQLQPAAEVLAQAGAQVGPPVAGQDEVDAVVQPARGQLGDLRLQVGKLPGEGGPVVDQQEDLAVAAQVEPGPAEGMPGGHRVDPRSRKRCSRSATTERSSRTRRRSGARGPGGGPARPRGARTRPRRAADHPAGGGARRRGRRRRPAPRRAGAWPPARPPGRRAGCSCRSLAPRPPRGGRRPPTGPRSAAPAPARGAGRPRRRAPGASPARPARAAARGRWPRPKAEARPGGRAVRRRAAGRPGPPGRRRRGRRRTGRVGGVDLQEGAPRGRGQVVGVGDPEDDGGLGGAEGPEADPEAEVAVEAAQATLVEALGGQQQVHAEAAPHPADGGEQVEELGAGGQELAELVDDDQQVRQRLQPWVAGASGGVRPQVGLVAVAVQEALAPGQLALEGGQARSTIEPSGPCRLVMSPATCGNGASSANAAPPLKSTSTKASWSGGWVAARPATTARSSSLLPEPVAPTTRPWGPMPSSAASLRSRTSGSPPGPAPTGTRRSRDRSSGGRPPGPAAPAEGPSRSRRRTGPGWAGPARGRSSRSGASRRAMVSQSASAARSARMPVTRRPPGLVSCSVAQPRSSTRTRIESSDGSPAVSRASQITVAPPAAARSGSSTAAGPTRGGGSVMSRTATRCGRSAGAPGSRVWGSQCSQHQAGLAVEPLVARMRRSSGAWKAASSQRMARARARVRSGGPVRARTPCWRSGTVTGAAGSRPARRTRCSAAWRSSGSCSARGPPAGSSRTGAASGTGPRPTRTVRKSSSAGRRSQRRSVWSTVVHSFGGSGCTCSAAASWAAANRSTTEATRRRWAR